MWLVATYKPVSLFSLKMTLSTSSGGKTLLVPTPYAVKLAMVDAAFRVKGQEYAEQVFSLIKDKKIRFNPPRHATVNHTFIKILREAKDKKEQYFIPSIAFREFCFFQGTLQVALEFSGKAEEGRLLSLAMSHINYFGKRGSFFQYIGIEECVQLGSGFSLAVPEDLTTANVMDYTVGQFLDDLGETDAPDLFNRLNTYSGAKMELGKHRVIKQYLLPYRERETTRSYTYYEKTVE